ncbi:MAG: Asp-tRNA(Asn)/Glu-tRNA(Gln) amidotransferase subunit GatA [Rhodocyclaceae bacterium]|nr:Asp-tRNA(Asn)/Glu-tRNA(Gln) amidotransferase subunit GatA [Rhodocyclaceae bacterium]MBK6906029.1 Asp-tRNA(Asn)/Glu-tRNA(Gln) amidotransferase subunit GatA [Rhodocyclaceae bacterium]
MINASLRDISRALTERRLSAVELATLFLERIERLNPTFNAFITVEPDKTLAQARAADARLASGNAGPLVGIPLAYKDIFCTKGMLTSCGSNMLSNFVAPYDAHVVEQLSNAGIVNLGKLNMDEFAMGSSTESSFFGPTKNPWDVTRVPGGSSGGSAAAVAARLAPVALGTDTGGSIRQPAAMCGLTGIKPTYGIVSRYGMVAYASSLDQGGPMAKSAADCALVLNGIAGFDQRDSTSLDRPAEDYTRALGYSIKGLRIGLPREFFADGMDDEVRFAIDEALNVYRSLGAELVQVDLPNSELSVPAYYVVAPAEASSNLSRFDGVRYGYRAPEYRDLGELYSRSRAQGFGAEVKRRIMVGTYVLSHGYYDAYYLKAQKLRRLIAEDFRNAFAHCDVIMGPTSPFVAFPIGAKTDDPVQMYLSDIYTVSTNLAGLPGLSIPCGFGAGNLPVGLQILGPWFDEARMLGIAHQYQQQTDWHLRMPGGVA